MAMRAAVVVVALLAGCASLPPGSLVANSPSIGASWTPPDRVAAFAQGSYRANKIADAAIQALLIPGDCPPEDVVPTAWIDKNETPIPEGFAGSAVYNLTLSGHVEAGRNFSVVLRETQPQTVPERGWCQTFTAGS